MFSVEEKKKIADAIENILLGIEHPEMPTSRPSFILHVDGKSTLSWADIEPNWKYENCKFSEVKIGFPCKDE